MTNHKFKRTIMTAALPYANGPVHIGHLAGCYLPADIYARYLRANKREVLFVCGSDEHGVPITIKAKKEGITPQQVVDKYHEMMKKAFHEFGISFDIYSRTSNKIHYETASEFFKTLHDKGVFMEETTKQYYDETAQQFLADRYIVGTCPVCDNDKAYGDQCEKCGSSLNATDLKNPHSTLSGSIPVLRETKNWFLPLDKLSSNIMEYIESHKDWKANVYGQCKSWLVSGDGLQPRAMTRDLDWGVPVPLPNAQGKVLYVWFDAPIGYISATKEYAQSIQKPESWKDWWQSNDSRLIHFIGKDNIVFHCLIFPAMLMEHGNYILPDQVPANEFLNLEGDKISTSRNWAVWLHEYLTEFKDMQDILRYTLCSNLPETKDNDFTWKDFQAKNNNELVAILGNFINRTLVLTHKYFEGKVPEQSSLHDIDQACLNEIEKAPARISESIEKFKFREALAEMMNLARAGNKYLADTEPWKLYGKDNDRVKTILHISLQLTANLAILCEPFLPFSAKKIRQMLNMESCHWDKLNHCMLTTGHQLGDTSLLYSKIEDSVIEAQIIKLQDSKKQNDMAEAVGKPVLPQKAETSFEEFSKMDIRTGTIIEAERVPKTDKLLKLKVKTGIDERTVVSGIAEYYEPEKIIGQKVCMLVNLAPRKIKGIESKGMILMAENERGELSFVNVVKDFSDGAVVK